MNLHEIYEMLMRRGMPEHRDLVWTAFAEPCVACALNGDVAILTTNTARDLITMHALRWIVGEEIELSRAVRWFARDGFCLDTENGNGYQAFYDPLEAILAATAHLEPKGDDDAKRP